MLQIEGLHDSPKLRSDAKLDKHVDQADRLVVTQITAGVRNPNRVNVFVDGKYTLSLDINQVVDLQVKVGKVLTETELQELHAASEFGKLYQRALEWVLTRPHSVRETQDYLKRTQLKRTQTNRKRVHDELKPLSEIASVTTELVLQRLVERGYVDDEKFAEYYVENRFVKKGVSNKRLRLELSKKGVSQNIINAALADTSRDDKDELAKMIRKKAQKYDQQKLIAYLVRQGFNYSDVTDAVTEYYREEDCETLN